MICRSAYGLTNLLTERYLFKIFPNYIQQELNDEWRQTILDINTADKEALPIIDVAPFDITNSGKKKEFLLELSPVCFYNSAITKLEN